MQHELRVPTRRPGIIPVIFWRHPRTILLPLLLLASVIVLLYIRQDIGPISRPTPFVSVGDHEFHRCRYQFAQSFQKYTAGSTEYTISIVTDMDKATRIGSEMKWHAILRKGTLIRDADTGRYSVQWETEHELISKFNEEGRGMELSELTYYDGRLFTFDDRTGLIFEVIGNKAIPYRIVMDGNGLNTKGMKIEWATVKDDQLYIGSTGKEWTTPQGEFINNNPSWIKVMDREGRIKYVDWLKVYTDMRKATKTEFPGYLLHEAVRWNAKFRRWFFLPRRASKEPYNDVEDERRGTNLMLSMDENFEDLRVREVGPLDVTHGFSSFQFIPWREDEFVALKTEEVDGKVATFITVLTIEGEVLMKEEMVGDVKFEGIEFT